ESQINILGFDDLKEMYKEDVDFKDAYEACMNPIGSDRSPYMDFMIQEGLLFKGNQLCIPRSSMREKLVKEKHSGSLVGHFGQNKTLAQLSAHYYWP
ncbi:hypothetical protein KI387_015048, partial [Taxus chinensis]